MPAAAAAAVLPSSPSSSSLCITARRLNPIFQRPLAVTLIRHHQQQQMAVTRASSLKDSGREPPVTHNLASLESQGFSANGREEDEEEKEEEEKEEEELARSPLSDGKRIDNAEKKSETLIPPDEKETELLVSGETALKGTVVAGFLLVGMVGGFGAVGYIYRDQINDFLVHFSSFIDGYGNAGYALFVAVYASLEVLAIPAVPLTMSAGLLFGPVKGTILVSISGTIAATIAFLIARYLARDRILKFAEKNKKFLAIDKAIGENSFRVVTLLRLSPLLPFSLGNYLYGLTSVELVPYVLGSWLGMLPGTWAYVSAGAFGRAFIEEEVELGLNKGSDHLLTLGLGLLVTVFAATYVTRLAKDAMKDLE